MRSTVTVPFPMRGFRLRLVDVHRKVNTEERGVQTQALVPILLPLLFHLSH